VDDAGAGLLEHAPAEVARAWIDSDDACQHGP
jgi:hypothetical protein